MVVQVSPLVETRIEQLVASGHFADAGDVVDKAVQLLEEHVRQLDELRAKLQVGLDDIARGAVHEYTSELREQISLSARRRAENGEQPSADVLP
jgi:putative addiction module CopG family antidote